MNKVHRPLGILGGMGPAATAYFFDKIIRMTDASCDQQHLDIILYNCATTPDRSRYLLGESSENPLTVLLPAARELGRQKVACIAIPCVTSCAFYEEISEAAEVPVIHTIRETVSVLKQRGITCAGIMATSGTISGGLFQTVMAGEGIRPVVPSKTAQMHLTTLIFQDIKAGNPPHMELFHAVGSELRKNGAEVVVLGCTELSVIKRDYAVGAGFLDALEVLAQRSILTAGGKLLPEYAELISPPAVYSKGVRPYANKRVGIS